MAIRIMCPNLKCRRVLAVPPEARGKTIRCKSCGSVVQVPVPAPKKPAVSAAVEAPKSTPTDESDGE